MILNWWISFCWLCRLVVGVDRFELSKCMCIRHVFTNFTTLQLKTRSKWPDHYDSLLYQLSYSLISWRGW